MDKAAIQKLSRQFYIIHKDKNKQTMSILHITQSAQLYFLYQNIMSSVIYFI